MSFFKRGGVRNAAVVAATALVAVAAAQLLASDANAATNGGALAIVNPANGQALPSGGSQTAFTFDLPASPADRCSGDSAAGGYFVYSYITPAANNPNNLTFTSSGPVSPSGSFAYTLVGTSGSPYRARQHRRRRPGRLSTSRPSSSTGTSSRRTARRARPACPPVITTWASPAGSKVARRCSTSTGTQC